MNDATKTPEPAGYAVKIYKVTTGRAESLAASTGARVAGSSAVGDEDAALGFFSLPYVMLSIIFEYPCECGFK